MPVRKPGDWNERELKPYWEKLNSASPSTKTVSVSELLRSEALLRRHFPAFLDAVGTLAKGGKVHYETFKRFHVVGADFRERAAAGGGGGGTRKRGGRGGGGSTGDEPLSITLDALQAVWSTVSVLPPHATREDEASRGGGRVIGIAQVMEHRALLTAQVPQLLSHFEDVDTSKDGVVSWSELCRYAGHSKEWLECEFDTIVGLEPLKEQIRDFHRGVLMDKARAAAGKLSGAELESGKLHMQFIGNPGTGKTTLGRLVGGLLHQAGLVGSTNFLEVQRDDLVAGYIGQTAKKTKEAVDKVGAHGCMRWLLLLDSAAVAAPCAASDVATVIAAAAAAAAAAAGVADVAATHEVQRAWQW